MALQKPNLTEKARKFAIDKLIEAHQIIDGIPDRKFDLRTYYSGAKTPQPTHYCNTVACAAGWLVLHPNFQHPNYKIVLDPTGHTEPRREEITNHFYFGYGLHSIPYTAHMADVMGLTYSEAGFLFSAKEESVDGPGSYLLTDKKAFSTRVKTLIRLLENPRYQRNVMAHHIRLAAP